MIALLKIGFSEITPANIDGSAADGRFSRIRQVAPIDSPMWAHWHHLANSIELMLYLAYTVNRSVQPSLFSSRQKVPILYNGRPFRKKLPLLIGGSGSNLIHDCLGQSEPTVQTALRSVQLFLHRWPQSVPIYLTMVQSFFSQRIINVWNSLSSDTVDFGTLRSFKRTIKLVDFSQFLKCF